MKKILAPLLLALLAMSMTAVVYAHEDGGTGEGEHTEEEKMRRDLDISVSPTAILIRSEVENGTVENHFGLLFTTEHRTDTGSGNGIVIHVAFSHENEVAEDVENEAFLHLRIAYLRLVEFDDANGNGAYDAGVDTELNVVDLRNKEYAPLGFPAQITSADGKTGWELKAATTDGMFQVTADIFPQVALVDSTLVLPTQTKITTVIKDFGNPNSRIALQVSAMSKTVIEHETPTSEERIRVRSATANGIFTWAPTAMVNGIEMPVVDSLQRLDDSRRWIINLAYPQGNIVHDPILGFEFGATPLLTTRLLIGAAIAAVAVFSLLVYLGRRQLVRAFNPKSITL